MERKTGQRTHALVVEWRCDIDLVHLAPRNDRSVHRISDHIVDKEHPCRADRAGLFRPREMTALVTDRTRATELARDNEGFDGLGITCFKGCSQAEDGVSATPCRVANPARNRRLTP